MTKTLLLLAVLAGTAALAQEPQPQPQPGTVYRLSPEQIDQIDPKPPEQDPKLRYDPLFDKSLFDSRDAGKRDRRVHSEVGAFAGSGGAHGVYGTTTVPVGDTGSASFSFENSDYGNRRYRRRW